MIIDREVNLQDPEVHAEAQAPTVTARKSRKTPGQVSSALETYDAGTKVTDEELDRKVRESIRDYGA